jgi:hypothetical protein
MSGKSQTPKGQTPKEIPDLNAGWALARFSVAAAAISIRFHHETYETTNQILFV